MFGAARLEGPGDVREGGAGVVAQTVGEARREGVEGTDEVGIQAPDGVLRAFDARAGGLVGGDGVGIVVLKRLADALADGD
ncbi:beta-ketoacyl synthase N-terminal-like domain-containing protein, partial [Streptomyces sp. MS191]|uniref:beta-ketoacyl synthase N-terminal-like domain-containing protein n=1 Tax=Streptomyces sp. ms191 TaxID=1827978 RepID=UPI00164F391E